ncbi:hypothetical protein BJF93_22935 [Xaviernesmea oryzae]|uniref:Sulfatase N-terminal domain-containing protein n=1 Tax=Xaviernesmea oryzae TaxID=464029 RepID=A0A1Q9AU62_9HYPH|nr:sulfatase-like hydrolase/transferase [Xaviernesmea oryzae]OLP58956.1 hypothetical protein BJF93_22935 [Xaviernesmea oryzae]SEM02773.1 Arylsulfatase A [Xaviernesmea oryzae]
MSSNSQPAKFPRDEKKPLDILLITADQWRGAVLPGARNPDFPVPTPSLDQLAGEGVRFARHYCQAYPCGPARAGLITGLYAHKHRVVQNGTPLDARHPTVFTEARRAGYRPTLFGYTDTMTDPRGRHAGDPALGDYEGVAPGLEVGTFLGEHAGPWLAHLKRKGYAVPEPGRGRDGIFAASRFGEPAVFAAEDSETAFLADRFIDFVSVHDEKPFFAHLSFIAPHPPFAAAAPWAGLIDPSDLAAPIPAAEKVHPLVEVYRQAVGLDHFVPGLSVLAAQADARTIAIIRAVYAGLMAEVDHHIGRIVAALKAAGRYERTLIVFTGDHGEQLFDHGLLGKLAFYDGSAHIPLILRHPRLTQGHGRTVEAFTQSIDILPTILEAIGIETPANADGNSLLPFCRGETPAHWRDAAFWSTDFRDLATRRLETHFGLPSERCGLQVVRTDQFKYVHFAGLAPVLFDLREDPLEQVDRIDDPAAAGLRREGLERLLNQRLQHEERTLTGYQGMGGRLYRDIGSR